MQSVVQCTLRLCRGCGDFTSLTRPSFPLGVASLSNAGLRLFWYRSVWSRHYKHKRMQPHERQQNLNNLNNVRSSSIWSPVTTFEPTRPPSQDRQSAGPRLTGAGAGGAARCVPSLRSVSETSGTWYPRRMLKRESRRRHLSGDSDMESAVVLLGAPVLAVLEDKTETAAALVWEGVGEAARACGGGAAVCVVSWRGTIVRRSPEWSTEGGLMRNVILIP
jgi:hypothetical protein